MDSYSRMQLRLFHPGDANACLTLFQDCVRRVNSRDYTREQVEAWAPSIIDVEKWQSRFDERFAYVVMCDEQLLGFADMTKAGYLDRLFVSADHQRLGIARLLVGQLLSDATEHSLEEITTDANITAKPFSQRMGFRVVREQTVICRGVELTNYRMRRVGNAGARH